MNTFFSRLMTLGVVTLAGLGVTGSAAANPFQIATDGSGLASAQLLSSFDLGGHGFVFQYMDPTSGLPMFQENGAFRIVASDGVSPIGTNDLTLTYALWGTADPLSGLISLIGGGFDLYSDSSFDFGTSTGIYGADDGTHVASFLVTGGSGDPMGTHLVSMSAQLVAGSLLPGYLFTADHRDMSQLASVTLDASFVDNVATPDATAVEELVCEQAGLAALGCQGTAYANQIPYYFLVEDSASVTLNAVPVPGSLCLGALGLAMLGMHRRRMPG